MATRSWSVPRSGRQYTVERFDYLLAAAGRTPNLQDSRWTHERNAHGVPLFDRSTLQCGDTPIFIAGDANDDVPLLHEAADEGRIAGENAARFPDVRPGVRRAGLAIVFSDPQIAVVGGGFRAARDLRTSPAPCRSTTRAAPGSCSATADSFTFTRNRQGGCWAPK